MTLTGAPAGTVATRVAGLADFRAVLEWEEASSPPPSCLPAPEASFRYGMVENLSACGTRLELEGTVRALTHRELGGALERLLRHVADAAAVSGAVLEMRVLREEPPRGAPPALVEALATDLWRAGFRVGFAPCWEPGGPDGLALGVRGDEERLRAFLADHPLWSPS